MKVVESSTKDAQKVYEMVAASIYDVCSSEMNLKYCYLCADGASNVRKCGQDHFLDYVRCVAHGLNIIGERTLRPYKKAVVSLVEKDALGMYSNLISDGKKFVLEMKKMALTSEKFGLKQHVPTRWFSEFECIESVMRSIDILTVNADDFPSEASDHLKNLSTVESRVLYKELAQVIQPLKDCNRYFQANSITIPNVVPFYLSLLDEYEEQKITASNNQKVILKFASLAIIKQMETLSPLHFLAVYLSPPTKNLVGIQMRLDKHNINIDAQSIVDSEIQRISSILPEEAVTSPQVTPKRQMTFVEKCLNKSTSPPPISLIEERIYYERDSRQCPPQLYWPMAKSIYPKLGQIAWRVFAVPTTESDVERSFSILKNVYASNRLSIDLKFLENMMLIKEMPSN
ncbi:hypothetical protein B9Z55_023492 [Caenorhabditis nigoni]|uniref:HAT C-terminal dimerisation domain-containing protein n=1 Tax=Caenorhabditis nigoni TaxID=1611254 RepID=A0A2G5SQF8_9PELO|nr:hypothetical protein B9Z55_023492 [Caenorhabditis nigoni]